MGNSIVTQSAVQPVRYTLNQVAANLASHANASLSKAHGFNLLYLPPGTLDSSGNDISTYQDNHGDVIGHYFLVFTVNNTVYYAPANSSSLAGQPASLGLAQYGADTASTLPADSTTAWITDISTGEIASLNSINDNILLAHTLHSYWEVHGLVQVSPKVTFDSIGHIIGHYVANINYGGYRYEIPCDTRLGGPLQLPRVYFDKPSPHYENSPAGSGPPYNYTVTPIVVGGTKPFTFSYQYDQGGTYAGHDIPADVSTEVPWVSHTGTLNCIWASSNGAFTFVHGGPGGSDFAVIRIKLTVTNAAGSITTDINGNPLIYEFQVQDNAPCCWFCSEANKYQRLSPEEWQLIGTVEQAVYRLAPRPLASYVKHGDRLVNKMIEQGVDCAYFVTFTQRIVSMAREGRFDEAARFYVDFVARAVRQYWPETKIRGFVYHLNKCNPGQ